MNKEKIRERKDKLQHNLSEISSKAMAIHKLSDHLSGSLWQCIDILDDEDSDLIRAMGMMESDIKKWNNQIPKQIIDIVSSLKKIRSETFVLAEDISVMKEKDNG